MTRIYLNQSLLSGQIVELSKDQRHYLEKVLRLQSGASLFGFNERDGEWQITFEKPNYVCVTQTRAAQRGDPLWLAFAPLKHDPMTFLIEKATELGATNLQPILTERTNTQRINLERLQKNAIEAAQQCERLDMPIIHKPLALGIFLQKLPEDVHWYAAIERADKSQVKRAVRVNYPAGFIIGPEGGWSESEKLILKTRTTNISLGKNILRAETAALVCLSLIISTKDT
jgi:16S rRNA (uracil1498-N3)-methyltransferase